MKSYKSHSDEELVKLYVQGNNEAFDALLSRYNTKVYNYIYGFVHNEALAEDLFQETFIKAIITLKQGGYSESGKFSSWLMRIAHNWTFTRSTAPMRTPRSTRAMTSATGSSAPAFTPPTAMSAPTSTARATRWSSSRLISPNNGTKERGSPSLFSKPAEKLWQKCKR